MSSFSDIYGYETIKEHMQSAIRLGKVSHAYIINGGLGAGKKMLAGIFAKTLQCENMEESVNPCNKCHSCIQSDTGNQPDIIWVKHEKPASIGVDDVREQIIADMQIKPYSSRYKIYIIDEAEKLTVAAQNALLKTIEEPPSYGIVIFLTTNADIFLQTILSRCVMLDLKPIKNSIVEEYIRNNYMKEISMQDAARMMNYSDAYFCKLFKQCFDQNFTSYLTGFRVNEAKKLLKDRSISVKDVSMQVGYYDSNYFAKVFKRMTGMIPSEYRDSETAQK